MNFQGFSQSAPPVTVRAHLFNVTTGNTWTPTNIPAGQVLIGLSMAVLTAQVAVVDSDGTASGNLVAGVSLSWRAATDSGTLVPPNSITAATVAGRALVTMVTRDA